MRRVGTSTQHHLRREKGAVWFVCRGNKSCAASGHLRQWFRRKRSEDRARPSAVHRSNIVHEGIIAFERTKMPRRSPLFEQQELARPKL